MSTRIAATRAASTPRTTARAITNGATAAPATTRYQTFASATGGATPVQTVINDVTQTVYRRPYRSSGGSKTIGKTAGIVIASIIGAIVLAILAYVLIRRYRTGAFGLPKFGRKKNKDEERAIDSPAALEKSLTPVSSNEDSAATSARANTVVDNQHFGGSGYSVGYINDNKQEDATTQQG